MATGSIVGFVGTVAALAVFLGVSFRQLSRVRMVVEGRLQVGGHRDEGRQP